jgi:hypothetical protein
MDPPVVKKHGDEILTVITDLIKGKEKEIVKTRENPALAYMRSLMPPVGPMAAQALQPVGQIAAQTDTRLRDERSPKRSKVDDATQLDKNNEDDASTVVITETLTNDDAVAKRVEEVEQNGSMLAVE